MRNNKKHLDFELNLVSFIDLLSVCICFLLITAVWLNIGSVNVKQAVGGQSQAETEKKPTMWVQLSEQGDISMDVKEASRLPASLQRIRLPGAGGHFNLEALAKILSDLKNAQPDLRTALIQPKAQTTYEEIIDLMDQFKKAGMADLGVVPL